MKSEATTAEEVRTSTTTRRSRRGCISSYLSLDDNDYYHHDHDHDHDAEIALAKKKIDIAQAASSSNNDSSSSSSSSSSSASSAPATTIDYAKQREVLKRPTLALPTVALFAVCLAVWSACLLYGVLSHKHHHYHHIRSFIDTYIVLETPNHNSNNNNYNNNNNNHRGDYLDATATAQAQYYLQQLLRSSSTTVVLSSSLLACSVILSTVASFCMFTVAHDAVHRSISKNPWINDSLGFVSLLFLGPTVNFFGFRSMHLKHHAHTNHPEEDPDMWCSSHSGMVVRGGSGSSSGQQQQQQQPLDIVYSPRPLWEILLRWATLDVSYILNYLPLVPRDTWRMRSLTLLPWIACLLLTAYLLFFSGSVISYFAFFYWILPGRIAIFLLAFLFDFLPHYPHFEQSRMRNTALVTARGNRLLERYLLTGMLLYQNLHVIHHLHPTIPFYRYHDMWQIKREHLSLTVPRVDIVDAVANAYHTYCKKIAILWW